MQFMKIWSIRRKYSIKNTFTLIVSFQTSHFVLLFMADNWLLIFYRINKAILCSVCCWSCMYVCICFVCL